MATFKEHFQKHSKTVVYHIRKHHKKYIFGIVGGAIAVKLALTFIASIGLYEGYGTFAQEIPGDEIKQENNLENINTFELTGDTLTGDTLTGDTLTGNTLTGDTLTGDTLTGDTLTGDTLTGDTLTGNTLTGDTLTGDTLTGNILTGSENTGENLSGSTQTGSENTGGFTAEPQNQNTTCNNSDFNFINPLSGSKLKGTINFSRTYSGTDCSGKNFDIYLRDHNNQRTKIGTSSYLNTRFQFNSLQLYSGSYDNYKIRLTDQNDNIVYTGNNFTIDNQLPEITGIVAEFTGNYNLGYIGLSGIINLNFTATEDLTGIIVNILGTNANFISKSGLDYRYSLTLSNQNSGTNVSYNISFSDLVGNTGSKYLTSQVIFDKLAPVLNYILFTGTYTGLDVSRSGNELSKYEFTYTLSGSQTGIVFTSSNYTYTGLINITGLNRNRIYNFIFKLIDPINNILAIGGKISFTTGGKVGFTYQIITISSNSGDNITVNVSTGSTGEISTISNIIIQEINKFNECKKDIKIKNINIKINDQDIKLNMPDFGKSDIKKIVNSFTIVIMDKLEKSSLTKKELDNIVDGFDDFLIILKLVRDNENQCKQNLSSYHIRLFQKILQEYKISIE